MFGKRRRHDQDVFRRSVAERRATEDERPWFLQDDDAPELEVDAGRSASMERLPDDDAEVDWSG